MTEDLEAARKIGFGQGVAYAAAELAGAWGQDSIAEEILGNAGLDSVASLEEAQVDEADLDRLRRLFEEDCPDCSKAVVTIGSICTCCQTACGYCPTCCALQCGPEA